MTRLIDKFDKIFCLNLSHRKDRRDKMTKQLDALGVLNSPKFEWHISTTHLHSNIMAQAINQSKLGHFSFPNELNCAREHYSIVKKAFDLGYEHILVIEDDLLFNKDESFLSEVLDHIPENYDILQFGGFSSSSDTVNASVVNAYWMNSVHAWNCSMYALSRKGMKFYMKFQERFFSVADNPLYHIEENRNIINGYLCRKPVVIQEISESNLSDIRPNTEVTRNLNVNLYEKGLDRSEYGISL